uniref:Chitin-binding type-2 domain-containing protein n=2 Tax=Clytia hemisphaerica TaxID=252671 RepID=A0A7M5U098_9CNID
IPAKEDPPAVDPPAEEDPRLVIIKNDLNNAFGNDAVNFFLNDLQGRTLELKKRVINKIEKVYVITWFKMVQERARESQQVAEQNTFQALLIKASVEDEENQLGGEGWFLKTYFKDLKSPGGRGRNDCKERAHIGISIRRDDNKKGDTRQVDLRARFNDLPTIFNELSNEFGFNDQGSFTFDLNSNTDEQPVPPTVRCGSSNDPRCLRPRPPPETTTEAPQPTTVAPTLTGTASTTDANATTTTTEDAIQQSLNDFCLFREDGGHALPSNCDLFIYCSHGRGSFENCPEGTKYNPIIRVCDFVGNFECRFDGLDVSELQVGGGQPTAVSNNLCFFLENGQIPDPNSCENFYSCSNTQSIQLKCPAGLFFKPDFEKNTGMCDFPRNVKCSGKGDRTDMTTTTVTPPKNTTTKAPKGKFHPRKLR